MSAPSRSVTGVVVATLISLVILIGLGVWQLQRLQWKEALITAANERATAMPVAPPPEGEWGSLDPAAYEYRRVRLAGVFRHDDEVLVYTALSSPKGPAGGQGYWVMTPLMAADGSTVIVNRGFVPLDRADRATRPQGEVVGPVTLTGLMRVPDARNWFTPDDDPAKGTWFTRDPAVIAAATGLTRVAPFFVDAEASAPGGLPQGGETRLVFPNRHLGYALTWFGLAAALVGVAGAFILRQRREAVGDPGGKRATPRPWR